MDDADSAMERGVEPLRDHVRGPHARTRMQITCPARLTQDFLQALGWYRRLSKDYEELTENSEAMIVVSMIHRMLRHLKPAELAAGWET
jgi:hypothetical protein